MKEKVLRYTTNTTIHFLTKEPPNTEKGLLNYTLRNGGLEIQLYLKIKDYIGYWNQLELMHHSRNVLFKSFVIYSKTCHKWGMFITFDNFKTTASYFHPNLLLLTLLELHQMCVDHFPKMQM